MYEVNTAIARAHLGLLLWAGIVGLSFPAVGLMSEGLPPLLLTALRFAIAALAILPLAVREGALRPSFRGMVLYAVMGLCLAGFFGAMFWAAHRTTALSMAAIYVCVPLLAFGLGRIAGVERPDWRLFAILLLGGGGALAIAWAEAGGRLDSLRFGIGETFFALGCLATALYPVLSKWGLGRGYLAKGPAQRTFWSLLTGGLLIALLGLMREAAGTLAVLQLSDVLLLVYLGVFSSAVTFWLMQRATALLTPGTVTAYTYLMPFVAMLLLFVGEPQRMTWHWLPGSLLVLLAMLLLRRRDVQRTQPPLPAPKDAAAFAPHPREVLT